MGFPSSTVGRLTPTGTPNSPSRSARVLLYLDAVSVGVFDVGGDASAAFVTSVCGFEADRYALVAAAFGRRSSSSIGSTTTQM